MYELIRAARGAELILIAFLCAIVYTSVVNLLYWLYLLWWLIYLLLVI